MALSEETSAAFNTWYKQHAEPNNSNYSPDAPSSPSSALPHGVITVQPEETRPYYLPGGGRPRLRTSFDPEQEIPQLQKWFRENPHPSREQMMNYLDQLNQLHFRQGSKALELSNIAYWFKNTRAAQRRASKSGSSDPQNSDSANDEGELDLSMDSERSLNSYSPVPVTTGSPVPELPNRNAVYVVNPMYPLSPPSHHRVEVVNVNEEEDHDRHRHQEDEPMDASDSENVPHHHHQPSEVSAQLISPHKGRMQ